MSETRARTKNGVDLEALRETTAAIREIPAAIRFRFGTESSWIGGSRTLSPAMKILAQPVSVRIVAERSANREGKEKDDE